MRAGKLDRTIIVERATRLVSPAGTVSQAWSTLTTLRAQIIQTSTYEFLRDQGEISEAAIVFRTRYHAGLTTADRVTYEGRAMNVVELKELGRRQGLEIRCKAVTQ